MVVNSTYQDLRQRKRKGETQNPHHRIRKINTAPKKELQLQHQKNQKQVPTPQIMAIEHTTQRVEMTERKKRQKGANQQ